MLLFPFIGKGSETLKRFAQIHIVKLPVVIQAKIQVPRLMLLKY